METTDNRIIDAADHAATTLRRLAREQDAFAVALDHATLTPEHERQGRAALATSRGEAVAAVSAALGTPLWNGQHNAAMMQWRSLTGSAPIPSATLVAWADGWAAYAAREAAATDPIAAVLAAFRPCGCHDSKVAAGRCESYAPDGTEREDAPARCGQTATDPRMCCLVFEATMLRDGTGPGYCSCGMPVEPPTADPDPAVAAVSAARATGGSTEDGTELCSYCRGMPRPGTVCPTCARRGAVEAGQAALAERGSLDAVLAGDGLRREPGYAQGYIACVGCGRFPGQGHGPMCDVTS